MIKFLDWIKLQEESGWFSDKLKRDAASVGKIISNTISGNEGGISDVLHDPKFGINKRFIKPLKSGPCGGRSCSRGYQPSYDFESFVSGTTASDWVKLTNIKQASVSVDKSAYQAIDALHANNQLISSSQEELRVKIVIETTPGQIFSVKSIINSIYQELKINPSIVHEPNSQVLANSLKKTNKSGMVIVIPGNAQQKSAASNQARPGRISSARRFGQRKLT